MVVRRLCQLFSGLVSSTVSASPERTVHRVSQTSLPLPGRDNDGRRLPPLVNDLKKSLYRFRKCAVVPKIKNAIKFAVTPGMNKMTSWLAALTE
ncbi:hypothetical protein LTR17_018470 [Elasticomyces elasticus]|nr:hypothetical protein LTR17_018470 [Elasticomyces elasticus]